MKEKSSSGGGSSENNGSGPATTTTTTTTSSSSSSGNNTTSSSNTTTTTSSSSSSDTTTNILNSPYDQMNFMAPPVGGTVKCVTCLGNTVQGKVMAYDSQTRMLALSWSLSFLFFLSRYFISFLIYLCLKDHLFPISPDFSTIRWSILRGVRIQSSSKKRPNHPSP